jgi:serine/threonine-protein kinase
LSQRLRGSTPLAPPTVAAIVRQAASALAAAHARGIVHRDVKPANLLLDAADRLTVVDFGIARAADAVSLTATNTMLGTAHYLSPEQVAGQSATACSDVYALGVVAYRCLAGRLPFDGDGDIAVALAHREQPVPELPDGVPEGFAALVRQMLSKAPGGRPSAADIVTRASQLAEDRAPMVDPAAGAPAMAGPDSTATAQLMATDVTGRAADRPARRRPVALAAAGGATALAVALAFLVGGSGGGGIDDAPAAPPVSVPSTSSSPSASATSSASARTSAGTPRSSGGHRILTRQVAPPSHEPAPPAKPKPKSKPEGKPKSKSKPKPPAPKQQSKPPPKPKAKPPGPKPPAPKQKPHVR